MVVAPIHSRLLLWVSGCPRLAALCEEGVGRRSAARGRILWVPDLRNDWAPCEVRLCLCPHVVHMSWRVPQFAHSMSICLQYTPNPMVTCSAITIHSIQATLYRTI